MKEHMPNILKRRGYIEISDSLLLRYPYKVKKVLSEMLVIGHEFDWSRAVHCYKACSTKFRVLPEGEILPQYEILEHEGKLLFTKL